MSASTFFTPDAKAKVAATVADVERQTSAEIVVTVRKTSGHYRHADYLCGVALATVALVIFLFHPEPFDVDRFPLEFAGFFVVGALISAFFPPLRRLLTSSELREENALTSARAAFVELGVSRTKGRTGVLVFVSMFERRVEVVTDIGVDEKALGPRFDDAKAKLTASLRGTPHLDRFRDALAALGPILGEALPRAADDVNELSDEVRS